MTGASQPVLGHGGSVVRGTVLQSLPPQHIMGGVTSYSYGGTVVFMTLPIASFFLLFLDSWPPATASSGSSSHTATVAASPGKTCLLSQ